MREQNPHPRTGTTTGGGRGDDDTPCPANNSPYQPRASQPGPFGPKSRPLRPAHSARNCCCPAAVRGGAAAPKQWSELLLLLLLPS